MQLLAELNSEESQQWGTVIVAVAFVAIAISFLRILWIRPKSIAIAIHLKSLLRCLGVVVLVGLICALYRPLENWRGGRAWEEALREIESRGEKIDAKGYPIPKTLKHATNSSGVNNWFVTEIPVQVDYLRSLPLKPDRKNIGQFFNVKEDTNSIMPLVVIEDAPLPDALRNLARIAGVNLQITNEADSPFNASISFRWENVSAIQAIDAVLQNHNLEAIPSGANTFLIVKRTSQVSQMEMLDRFRFLDVLVRQYETVEGSLHVPFENIVEYDKPDGSALRFASMRAVGINLCSRAKIYAVLGDETNLVADLQRVATKMEFLETIHPATVLSISTRAAIAAQFAGTISETLRADLLSADAVVRLQQRFTGLDLLRDLPAAMRMERAIRLDWMRSHIDDPEKMILYLRQVGHPIPLVDSSRFKSPIEFANQIQRKVAEKLYEDDLVTRFFVWAAPPGWIAQNSAALLRRSEIELEVAENLSRRHHDSSLRDLEERVAETVGSASTPYNFVLQEIAKSERNFLYQIAKGQVASDEALIALALHRFHAATHDYPASLEQLVPQFLTSIPSDLFDGQPLHYRRVTNSRYVLYSIGWNDKDDGGDDAFPSTVANWKIESGDWVWGGVPQSHN